ncbi:MAG: hypothetical protein OXC95_06995, partial [Dehalococcoidia bacterium]|nr:hypothetical protein [Dehalococcoidia bacterium]
TDGVMGAVPEANAGIASAMNDVTRQVAGAFGVAVVGSVLNTAYGGGLPCGTKEWTLYLQRRTSLGVYAWQLLERLQEQETPGLAVPGTRRPTGPSFGPLCVC